MSSSHRIRIDVSESTEERLASSAAILSYPGRGWYKAMAKQLVAQYRIRRSESALHTAIRIGFGQAVSVSVETSDDGYRVRFTDVHESD